MFNFEKLDVWQKAISFAELVCEVTSRLPADERFGLTIQMRRAAVSISSNHAEGSARHGAADFARFIEISAGSLFETVSQASIAQRRGFLAKEAQFAIYTAAEELSRMLSGLRARMLER